MIPPDDESLAIHLESVGIRYRRYRKRLMTLKDHAVSFFRGARYEHFWALRDIELSVPRGSTLGVVGANGSGKSTLLKAICGVLPPTTGQVRSRGRIAPLLELGGGFNAELTGRENIFLNGAIMGLSHAEMEEKIERIIDFAEIGDFIDVPIQNYSSGMRGRLGFAVATDIDPDILLLDEVLSVGDASFRRKAVERMESFFTSDKTIVVVTHDLGQIQRLCDRAIFIDKGHIAARGDVDEVLEAYRQWVAEHDQALRKSQ